MEAKTINPHNLHFAVNINGKDQCGIVDLAPAIPLLFLECTKEEAAVIIKALKDLYKRADGYYKVRGAGGWIIAEWNIKKNCFVIPGSNYAYSDDAFMEINEKRIEV